MGTIRMKIEVASMEIPFLFIDRYMTNCLPVYPLIYMYSYRHAMVGNAVTCQDIEDTFQLTERDVLKAWKHWETQGLVSIDHSNDDMDVTFLPVTIAPVEVTEVVAKAPRAREVVQKPYIPLLEESRVSPAERRSLGQSPIQSEGSVAGASPAERRSLGQSPIQSEGSVAGASPAERRGLGQSPIQRKVLESQIYLNSLDVSDNTGSSLNAINSPVNNKPESIMEIRRRMMPTQPNYSVHELAEYKNNSREVAHLFAHAEQALGKLLSPTDMSKIFSFYDWLRLPFDVIEYLLSYCADNDKRGLKYIETCAIDWAERGIEDLVMALEYVQSFDNYNSVLRRLGLKNVTVTSKKSFERWTTEWQMPMELILNACDRAIENNVPKITYVEGILKKWYDKGINTAEGVRRDDEAFESAKQLRIDSHSQIETRSNKKKFANFQQRDTDLSHIEQHAREYQMQKAQELSKDGKTWQERRAESRGAKLLKEG